MAFEIEAAGHAATGGFLNEPIPRITAKTRIDTGATGERRGGFIFFFFFFFFFFLPPFYTFATLHATPPF